MSNVRPPRLRLLLLAIAPVPILAACGGSSGGVVIDDTIGTLEQRPDGALFFVDENQRGQGSDFRLMETFWARILDIYDADGAGVRGALPLMRRAPVRPDLASDGVEYRLESDALGREALVILHPSGTAAFENALADAVQELPRLVPKQLGSVPPFTGVARNAALVLRFDDLLAAGPDERRALADNVHLATGYPPTARFQPRVYFDEAHGDMLGTDFHPTRVVIDLTISAVELDADTGALPLNVVGLPPSSPSSNQANVELRIPTREDFGTSQFSVLRNPRGRTLDPEDSFPFDPLTPTLDVVRVLRSGNENEPHNGFLRDDTPPSLVARWPLTITLALADPEPGFFLLDLEFSGTCVKALRTGELLELDGAFLEVAGDTAPPDGDGRILAVRVRALAGTAELDELVGGAQLFAQFDPALTLDGACWVEVDGEVGAGTGVAPVAVFGVRFNEPVDPDALDPLETLRLYRDTPDYDSTVVASIAALDGTSHELVPLAPLAHTNGVAETYLLEIRTGTEGVTDLAGNALVAAPAPIELELASSAATLDTGGLTLRFASANEYDPAAGKDDLRGLFSYDTVRGALRPRPVVRQGFAADGTSGLSARMLALPVSIREPLVPFGSRFQTLWRYADFRWAVEDESLYDLDVEGIGFASFGGLAGSDFFQSFEVRLGHSSVLPDEAVDPTTGALLFPDSGLQFLSTPFDANVLEADGARVVHPRDLGYRIRASDQFVTASGTRILPLPLERAGRTEPFVWRDTALHGTGGFNGGGIPLTVEKTLDPEIDPGSVAVAGSVPSFGLPLLMEIRCFPSDTALGQNGFQTAAAVLGQLFPTFRVHSTGGIGPGSSTVRVDPDAANVPAGGFNPSSTPPGQRTRPNDPAFYFGQLDTVTRVTRVHSVWFDTGSSDPDYLDPLVAPRAADQPAGTAVVLEFRGADSFSGTTGAERDATRIDVYGEPVDGVVNYPGGDRGWKSDIDALDGLRYVQVRMTFVSNTDTGLTPTLDSFALAFRRP